MYHLQACSPVEEILSKKYQVKPQVGGKSVRLINVDVIYFASLVKYFSDSKG